MVSTRSARVDRSEDPIDLYRVWAPAGRTLRAQVAGSVLVRLLERTTRERLVAFHRARYRPDHAALAIAGDVSVATVRSLMRTTLAGWQHARTSPRRP